MRLRGHTRLSLEGENWKSGPPFHIHLESSSLVPESRVGKDKEAEVRAGRLQRERMRVTPSSYSKTAVWESKPKILPRTLTQLN